MVAGEGTRGIHPVKWCRVCITLSVGEGNPIHLQGLNQQQGTGATSAAGVND